MSVNGKDKGDIFDEYFDKPIIIDGVNVAKCEYYEEMRELPDNLNGGYYIQHCYCGLQGDNYCICNKNHNCYFKQLQRLKKENEKLKNKNNDLIEEIASGNIDIAILQKENEELKKKKIKSLGFICDCEENERYKQALEEIKEIINEQNLISDKPISQSEFTLERLCNYEEKYIKIVDKIDEVLNDRD